jgi:hypothetical protein
VAEQCEHPERIGRPPIAFVAVEHDGAVPGDALSAEQRGEVLRPDVVAHYRVVEIGVPVDCDRAGNVPGAVEQYVFVRLHHDQSRLAEALGQPLR